MREESADIDLAELAGSAGVSIRTVRYYQQQGLLRSPGQKGPGARYGQPDLDRLRLIRLLQREHLPLAEIRRRLEAMTDTEVAEALAAEAPPVARGSAAEYARQALEAERHRPAGRARPSSPGLTPFSAPGLASKASVAAEDLSLPAEPERRLFGVRRAAWERIELGPDIELHVRRPLSLPQNRLVERLIDAARRFHQEEERP